ncbi:TetR family transcriptional regulator [Alishewanella longhuensis]|uniref:TetR family transcriptional regulator n=1 Tax=Alishewanella longhuensis TaxID=1091037 RepID=A0ABQ3KX89_9ALTE|nr:TetR family transcriptional regulator [Alishewanella longhuensis]GHG63783.1 TetR family transcriptional regulator [Alishewanella longhuensis]
MTRPCKADSEQTRDRILDAAEQMFLEYGYGKTSLEMIARAGGFTRGAIYWHFSDKVSLFNAMLQRVKLPMERMFEQKIEQETDPLQALYEMCHASLMQLFEDERHYRVHAILLTRCEQVGDLADLHQHDIELHNRIRQRCEALFVSARAQGRVAADLDEKLAALSLKSYVMGLYLTILREQHEQINIEMVQRLLAMYFDNMRRATVTQ